MVDPLGPFVTLIRSLSRRKAEANGSSAGSAVTDAGTEARGARQTARSAADLRTRLHSRLSEVGTADPDRARRTFVETVLLCQLGEELARDPAFSELVARVADEIKADRELRSHLSELIDALAA